MKTYLEPEEVEVLEQAAANLRDQLLIRLLFRLGCRISEALAIRAEDIDFQQGTVRIQNLKTDLKLGCPHCNASLGRSHVFCPRCGIKVEEGVAQSKEQRRVRALPLGGDTLGMLRGYSNRGGRMLRSGKDVMFAISRYQAWPAVRNCADRAGLGTLVNPETGRTRGISPHRLRDAFAVHAMKLDDSGDGLRLLQEHLGHVSFSTTARYRKVGGDEHRRWYERLWNRTPR